MTNKSQKPCSISLVKAGLFILAKSATDNIWAAGLRVKSWILNFKIVPAAQSMLEIVPIYAWMFFVGFLVVELAYLVGLILVLITDGAEKFSAASLFFFSADREFQYKVTDMGVMVFGSLILCIFLVGLLWDCIKRLCDLGKASADREADKP